MHDLPGEELGDREADDLRRVGHVGDDPPDLWAGEAVGNGTQPEHDLSDRDTLTVGAAVCCPPPSAPHARPASSPARLTSAFGVPAPGPTSPATRRGARWGLRASRSSRAASSAASSFRWPASNGRSLRSASRPVPATRSACRRCWSGWRASEAALGCGAVSGAVSGALSAQLLDVLARGAVAGLRRGGFHPVGLGERVDGVAVGAATHLHPGRPAPGAGVELQAGHEIGEDLVQRVDQRLDVLDLADAGAEQDGASGRRPATGAGRTHRGAPRGVGPSPARCS